MRLVKGFVTRVGLYYLLEASVVCVVSFGEVFSTRRRQEAAYRLTTDLLLHNYRVLTIKCYSSNTVDLLFGRLKQNKRLPPGRSTVANMYTGTDRGVI